MQSKANQARIGTMCIGLNVYWNQFPGLQDTVIHQYLQVNDMIPDANRLVRAGLVDSQEKAVEANVMFREQNISILFCYCATYSTSENLLPAIRGLKIPVIVLNLQPTAHIDYSAIHDIGSWLGTLSCAGTPEVTAVLMKSGYKFDVITGYIQGDERAQKRIVEWCRITDALHRLKNSKIGVIGHPFSGMMDLYVDETKLYNRMGVFVEFIEWDFIHENMQLVNAEQIQHFSSVIQEKFVLRCDPTSEDFVQACRVCAALDKLVKDRQLDGIAMHFAGAGNSEFAKIAAPMNIAFSILTGDGIPCCVEGDIKTTIAMLATKLLTDCSATSELYSLDFTSDICLIGHSGSSDFNISGQKPILTEVEIMHGKTGGGFLTQFFIKTGPVTMLALSEDGCGNYRFITGEGVSEAGEILQLGDSNTRIRFDMPMQKYIDQWSKAGPSHHFSMTLGRHADLFEKFAHAYDMECIRIQ